MIYFVDVLDHFKNLKKIFNEIGLRKLDGDEAVYYMMNEYGNLEGLVSTHVDDFDLAGTTKFVDKVTEEIGKALDVSQVEDDKFCFTGIDVDKVKDGIQISMEDYAKSLEEIQIRDAKAVEMLTRDEFNFLRKYIGKLSWLAANTRPDLAIYAFKLAKSNNQGF